MVRQSVRIALLVGSVAAVAAAAPARADQIATNGCCTPATRTICVTECVPETYTAKRIVYKTEQKCETYTAYRCESFPEVRERTVCTVRRVQEWQEQCRKVCVRVPVCEERTVMRPHYTFVNETKVVTKCVDRGHYECREQYSHWKAFTGSLGSLCGGHRDCCNSCNACGNGCDSCAPACPTVTRKVWVPCMVQESCTVPVCRKVCEMRPEVIKVNTCRTEIREEKCKVCVTRCIPETRVEKYTVCVRKSVPYQATRTVCCRVPCEETYTCTRMVARTVTREVPCTPACNTCDTCSEGFGRRLWNRGSSLFGGGCGCGSSCGSSCGGCGGAGLFSGVFNRGCGAGCGTGCGCH